MGRPFIDTESMINEDYRKTRRKILSLHQELHIRWIRCHISAPQKDLAMYEVIKEEEGHLTLEWRDIVSRARIKKLIEQLRIEFNFGQIRMHVEQLNYTSQDIDGTRRLLHSLNYPMLLPPYFIREFDQPDAIS